MINEQIVATAISNMEVKKLIIDPLEYTKENVDKRIADIERQIKSDMLIKLSIETISNSREVDIIKKYLIYAAENNIETKTILDIKNAALMDNAGSFAEWTRLLCNLIDEAEKWEQWMRGNDEKCEG